MERNRHRGSILQRFGVQMLSSRPEKYLGDFLAHGIVLFLVTVFAAYFSLHIDQDPDHCYASPQPKATEAIDAQTMELMGSDASNYEDVG